jgi:hypothetical protein
VSLPPGDYYAWIAPLDVPWRWFGTLTFRSEVSAERAYSAFRRWIAKVNEAALGRDTDREVRWVCSVERHALRDACHVHVLVADVESVSRTVLRDRWTQGLAKLDAYDASQDGLRYVLKFASRPDTIIDLSPPVVLGAAAA